MPELRRHRRSSSSKSSGPIAPRLLVAIPLLAIILYWSYDQGERTADRVEWETLLRSGDFVSLFQLEEAPSAEAWYQLSRAIDTRVWPPNYEGAANAVTKALTLDPLNARYWIYLGRYMYFQGDQDAAREALAFSEKIDPLYAPQRLDAIPLWRLLGEEERAREIARQVAALSSEEQMAAAEKLVRSGYSPAEIYEIIGSDEMTTRELFLFVRRIRVGDKEQMADLFALLPEDIYSDQDQLDEFARLAAVPLVPSASQRFWAAKYGIQLPAGENLLYLNGDLKTAPYADPFFFGWQPVPPHLFYIKGTWHPPEDDADRGEMHFTFDESPERTGTNWVIYRTPLPARVAVAIQLDVRLEPPGRSDATIYVSLDREREIAGTPARRIDGWQTLSVKVPAQSEGALLELFLRRSRVGEAAKPDPSVSISNLLIVPTDEFNE